MMRALATAVAVIVAVLAISGAASSAARKPMTFNDLVARGKLTTPRTRREIRIARASGRYLSIFPAVLGKRHCVIPDGALGAKPLHGMCSTSVRPRRTMEPSWSVTFRESWPKSVCAPDLAVACSRPMAHATWQIVEGEPIVRQGARIHIYATHLSGAEPPQLYK